VQDFLDTLYIYRIAIYRLKHFTRCVCLQLHGCAIACALKQTFRSV